MSVYAASEPTARYRLPVSDIHELSIEEFGTPSGIPLVHLHGGPGAGYEAYDARRFDPSAYRIILIDQRGSGNSTPHACLEDNTTWHLVEDVEKVRKHLEIEKWHVSGGSWGSTLALAYAQTHPTRVTALVLRGIFTLRKSELDWFYSADRNGPSHIFPEEFEKYISQIPKEEQGDMFKAYYARLTSKDETVRKNAGYAWSRWEMATSRLHVSEEYLARADSDEFADSLARIEAHYFVNEGFMEDGFLLKQDQVDKIRHIPTTIVQGRYDLVCPYFTAYALHQKFPEANFVVIPDAGHSAKEAGIEKALVAASDAYRNIKQ